MPISYPSFWRPALLALLLLTSALPLPTPARAQSAFTATTTIGLFAGGAPGGCPRWSAVFGCEHSASVP